MEIQRENELDLELYTRQFYRLQRSAAVLSLDGTYIEHFPDPAVTEPIATDLPAEDKTEQIGTPEIPASDEIHAYLGEDEFRKMATTSGLTKGVATKYWYEGHRQAKYHHQQLKPAPLEWVSIRHQESIDLDLVLGRMRTMESGDVQLNGFGIGTWNFYAKLINKLMGDPDSQKPLVLHWQDGIHNRLKSSVLERRYEAADQLEDLYQKVDAAFTDLDK